MMHLKIVIGLAMASGPEQRTAADTCQHSIQPWNIPMLYNCASLHRQRIVDIGYLLYGNCI
jgi:hypothetical protein